MPGTMLLPPLADRLRFKQEAVEACIAICHRCAAISEACADACMAEPTLDRLATQLRHELHTADVCRATAQALARRAEDADGAALAQVSACAEVCELSAAACERHTTTSELCTMCARACRECLAACLKLLN